MVELPARLRHESIGDLVAQSSRGEIQNMSLLDEFLTRLAGEAGVTQALIVAGDIPNLPGSCIAHCKYSNPVRFKNTVSGRSALRDIPKATAMSKNPFCAMQLKRKNAYAERTGANVYIVTQFVFSADPVIAWETSQRDDIGRLPVTAGLPGLANARTLLKYAMECGVGESLQAFSKRLCQLYEAPDGFHSR